MTDFLATPWGFGSIVTICLAIVTLVWRVGNFSLSRSGILIGKQKKVSPHSTCPHARNIMELIHRTTEYLEKRQELRQSLLEEQMRFYEETEEEILGYLKKLFLSMLVKKVEDMEAYVQHAEYSAYDVTLRAIAADIKSYVRACFKANHYSVDESQKKSPSLTLKAAVGGSREGWYDYNSEVEKASEVFSRPTGDGATQNTDMLILYFTSGTTGFPKMVQHDFTYPLGHILTAKYWQNVSDNGLHYTVADTGWAKAVWGKIYGQWLAGCAVFVYEYDRFSADRMMKNIAKYGVTSFCAPPTVLRFVIKEDVSKYDFSKLKYCAVAGEPLNPEVYQQFLKSIGIKLMEGYGQTEMTVALATFPWMEPKPGSMGKPSPGYHIGLLNHEGRQCEAGEEGQIVVFTDKGKPVGMFEGYYRDDELTRSSWHDGVYYTGDMAWADEDGYYWFVGRADDVIKSSGYRIGPFEVESALLEHPAVLECAITGVPDPDRGAIVKATVVLTKGYTASDALAHELQEHVKKVTAPYKYPRIVEFVPELPKTISGKIRRVEIRDKDK